MLRRLLILVLILYLESLLKRRFPLGRHQWSSLRCYFILICLLYFTRHKELWRKNGQHVRLAPLAERQHMFIYNSFLFNERTDELNERPVEHVKLVLLFMAHKHHWVHDQMLCMSGSDKGPQKKMNAHKELISSLGICALDLYVLTCTAKMMPDESETTTNYSVVLRDRNFFGWRASSRFQVKFDYFVCRDLRPPYLDHDKYFVYLVHPRKPDMKPRRLVLCISRVFAFERWQLLLTALEAYRAFGVDLVVAHVQSALTAVFRLMQAYEREGVLSIRHGIRFPYMRGMPWDPNAETEFNGQILLAHECFYEFRQNTDFIGLIDWDDLLIPSRHFQTLPDAFAAAADAHPDAAYFLVNKLEANFVEETKIPHHFSLRRLMEHGIKAAPMHNDEKLMVLPKRLRGFWMHHSHFLEPTYRPVQLLTNYSIMLHLANEERVEPGEFGMPMLRRFNVTEMDRHSRAILRQLEMENVLKSLPRSQPYFEAIAECHRLIFAYFKATGLGKSHCLSYSLCELPKVDRPCMVVRSQFQSHLTRGGRHGVHIRMGSEFVESKQGCADKDGGI